MSGLGERGLAATVGWAGRPQHGSLPLPSRALWDLQPERSGEKVGIATQASAPCQLCPASESPNWLGKVLGQQLTGTPPFPHTLRWDAPGTSSMPPASLGRQEVGPQRGLEGQETLGQFMVGSRSQGRGQGWHSVQNQRYWGTCSWA